MSTSRLMGIWFLVFMGELLLVIGSMELWHIPWISIIALVVMMWYDVSRKVRAQRNKIPDWWIDYYHSDFDEDDITAYESTKDIFASGRFTPEERCREYRRRGKSPSGVIDGVYNDMYLEDGASYNDMDRDWDADA